MGYAICYRASNSDAPTQLPNELNDASRSPRICWYWYSGIHPLSHYFCYQLIIWFISNIQTMSEQPPVMLPNPCHCPECSTWHKFPNPGGANSTKSKNVIFPIQGAQYPDHVRTAASNVAKFLPPLPILLENEAAAAANFVGKWGRRRHFLREKWLPMWSNRINHKIHFKYLVWYLLLFKVFK